MRSRRIFLVAAVSEVLVDFIERERDAAKLRDSLDIDRVRGMRGRRPAKPVIDRRRLDMELRRELLDAKRTDELSEFRLTATIIEFARHSHLPVFSKV
jgi:hypothetical protein